MFNFKNNETDAVFDEICKKKAKIKIKFQKNEEYIFGQHHQLPLLLSHNKIFKMCHNKIDIVSNSEKDSYLHVLIFKDCDSMINRKN